MSGIAQTSSFCRFSYLPLPKFTASAFDLYRFDIDKGVTNFSSGSFNNARKRRPRYFHPFCRFIMPEKFNITKPDRLEFVYSQTDSLKKFCATVLRTKTSLFGFAFNPPFFLRPHPVSFAPLEIGCYWHLLTLMEIHYEL